MSDKTKGQIAYEADRRARPYYDGGVPRPQWHELDDKAKQTWERNPIPRWSES